MKKYIKVIKSTITILMIMMVLTTTVFAKEKIILIDAGHGGIDGGGRSENGLLEKDINLKLALKLKKVLKKEGYKVYLTREKDESLDKGAGSTRENKIEDLKKRCEMKDITKCDIFLSIHLNMFPSASAVGPQVWHASNEYSKNFAKIVQDNLNKDLQIKRPRVEKDAKLDYRILRTPKEGPEVIVECGFLSNYQEAEKLNDDKYQDKIIKSLKESIENYFKQAKKNNK